MYEHYVYWMGVSSLLQNHQAEEIGGAQSPSVLVCVLLE